MARAVGIQMDPMAGVNPASDTSLALAEEAHRRGYGVSTFHPDALWVENGAVFARVQDADFDALDEGKPTLGAPYATGLDAFDAILIRQDPPYDMAYHANTFMLEQAGAQTLVVNNPRGIRNCQEKLCALPFSDLMAKTWWGRDMAALKAFAAGFSEVVLKPVDLFGGEGVVRAAPDTPDFDAKAHALLDAGPGPIIAQEFLPAVADTDKRVMFIEGEVVGVLGRRPPAGGFVANIHMGGRAVAETLTPAETAVCARLTPFLKAHDILFAGIDLIDAKLSEINVTSPTLVKELAGVGGPEVPALFWDAVEARWAKRATT